MSYDEFGFRKSSTIDDLPLFTESIRKELDNKKPFYLLYWIYHKLLILFIIQNSTEFEKFSVSPSALS